MADQVKITRRPTRQVRVGKLWLGSEHPVAVQSMCATKTQDVERTITQIQELARHGADIVRVAVDSKRDAEALATIRQSIDVALVVDLQESYRLVEDVAPVVDKIRYNPGHLHHHQKNVPVFDKVKCIVDAAGQYGRALRIGVNFGSLDPNATDAAESSQEAALRSVAEHVEYMNRLGFQNFVVSLKSSNPNAVVELNRRFAIEFPEIPIHLGVTEAGLLPDGEIKTRIAFEQLLAQGIGDTIRVSLTLPNERKYEEVLVGRRILEDVAAGRFRSVPRFTQSGLNIISCPSCSRVENEKFVELAQKVREVSRFAQEKQLTVAVMGCRVNGPGETDDADLGLWCAPSHVNLKRRGELIGAFSYDEILPRVVAELQALVDAGAESSH